MIDDGMPTSSAMAIMWRNQARYCRVLAANNPDPRIRAALIRMAERLSAQASAGPSSSDSSVVARPRKTGVRIASVVKLRILADRCFADAESMSDPSAQDDARSCGYRYLDEATSLERREAQELLGDGRWAPITPLQNVALVELARVQKQIDALEAERPPERSARANIVSVLYRKKAELERVLAVAPPKPPPRRRPGRRPGQGA
jgi:hypothetical protein